MISYYFFSRSAFLLRLIIVPSFKFFSISLSRVVPVWALIFSASFFHSLVVVPLLRFVSLSFIFLKESSLFSQCPLCLCLCLKVLCFLVLCLKKGGIVSYLCMKKECVEAVWMLRETAWMLQRRRMCGGRAKCGEEGCLLWKIKLHAQLGQRFFCWGCRESNSFFYCLLGYVLGVQRVYGFGVQRICGEKERVTLNFYHGQTQKYIWFWRYRRDYWRYKKKTRYSFHSYWSKFSEKVQEETREIVT